MILASLALVLSLAAQSSAPAEQGAAEAPPAVAPAPTTAPAPAAVAGPNERICRRIQVTGSRFPVRECRTRAEFEQIERGSQEALRTMQQNRGGPGGAPR